MILRLSRVIRITVAVANRVTPHRNLTANQKRLELPRQCYTFALNTNNSAEIKLKHLLEDVKNETFFDAFQSMQILRSCVNSTLEGKKNSEIVESIWSELKKKSELNEEHYVQIMRYFECIDRTNEVLKLFDEMCSLGLKARPAGYLMVFRAHLKGNDTKKVWKFLYEFEEANDCVKENSLNSVLGHFLGHGDYDLALKAIELIRERGYEFDIRCITKHWLSHARNGEIQSLKNSLEFFNRNNLSLQAKDMMELVHELCIYGYSDQVNTVIFYMKNIKGNALLYKETIYKFIENGHSHMLPKLFYVLGINADDYKTDLVLLMEKFDVPYHEFKQTMHNLKLILNLSNLGSERATPCYLKLEQICYSEDNEFQNLYREKNLNGLEILLNRGNVKMSQFKFNSLIELYLENDQVENALKTLEKAIKLKNQFKLYPKFVIDLMKLMVMKDYDFEKINEILSRHSKLKAVDRSIEIRSFCQKLADDGQAEKLNKLCDLLVKHNIVQEFILYVPLITVHLPNNNFSLAIDVYEKLVATKNVAPHTTELMAFLIEKNEMELLNRVFKIYEAAKSTNSAQYRLAFAHLICGHDKEAESIFKELNMKEMRKFMTRDCEILEKFCSLEETKALLRLTKGMPVDRHLIYCTLLKIYCKSEQTENIIDLLAEHDADETAKPNKDFLARIVHYVKVNRIPSSKISLFKLEGRYKKL